MKKMLFLSLLVFCKMGFAQNKFSNCSAAFLDNKMIVQEYTAAAKCKVSCTAKGELTVSTVELSKKACKPVDNFFFSIAIKDKKTGTMMLFSKDVYEKIYIQKVLSKCKKGDSIVLLTTKDQYALPHNEILVE